MARSDRTGARPSATSAPSRAAARDRDRAAPLEAPSDRRAESGRRAGVSQSARRPAASRAQAGGDKVNVFVSYVHGDRVVAAALRDALIEVDRNRVECFLDSASIQSGEGWKEKLDAALAKADWLVCVYTGEQSQWCGYEVGVFAQNRAQAKSKKDARLVCLHDADTAPGLFAANQNKLIRFFPPGIPPAPAHVAPAAWSEDEVRFYSESSVFQLLSDFCKYKNLYPVRDKAEVDRRTQTLLSAAKRITLAFDTARASDVKSDTPTRLQLEVSFGSEPPGPLDAVPSDAQVSGTFASFDLFGLMPPMANRQLPSKSWTELKAACRQRAPTNALWMDSLEREMVSTMQGFALGAPEAVFAAASDGKLYRPILVRHVVRYDGSHQFDLVFIETLPRQFVGVATTSLLLAGLVQASRFRFTFLEQPDHVAAKFDDSRTDREFDVNCKQLRYDLDRIETEAAELGVLDLGAFVAAFGEGRRALAESFIQEWSRAKAALLPQLPETGAALTPQARGKAKAAIGSFIAAMEGENRSFVLAALDAYREEVAR